MSLVVGVTKLRGDEKKKLTDWDGVGGVKLTRYGLRRWVSHGEMTPSQNKRLIVSNTDEVVMEGTTGMKDSEI